MTESLTKQEILADHEKINDLLSFWKDTFIANGYENCYIEYETNLKIHSRPVIDSAKWMYAYVCNIVIVPKRKSAQQKYYVEVFYNQGRIKTDIDYGNKQYADELSYGNFTLHDFISIEAFLANKDLLMNKIQRFVSSLENIVQETFVEFENVDD